MKIRITRGIYGFRENGKVVEKTKSDRPFEVDDKEGARLIALKVAESADDDKSIEIDRSEKDEGRPDTAGEGYLTREELVSMSKEDLSRLAEELGVKKTGSKKELVEQLLQCSIGYEEEEPLEEDEVPDLNAEEPD